MTSKLETADKCSEKQTGLNMIQFDIFQNQFVKFETQKLLKRTLGILKVELTPFRQFTLNF